QKHFAVPGRGGHRAQGGPTRRRVVGEHGRGAQRHNGEQSGKQSRYLRAAIFHCMGLGLSGAILDPICAWEQSTPPATARAAMPQRGVSTMSNSDQSGLVGSMFQPSAVTRRERTSLRVSMWTVRVSPGSNEKKLSL